MTILYCDDEKSHLQDMDILFKKCFSTDKLILVESADSLGDDNWCDVQIFLLDIDLNVENNGTDYATMLAEKYPASRIIYVTAFTERFVESAFLNNKNVCGFLKKPVQEDSLINAVTKAKKEIDKDDEVILIKPTDMKLAIIPTSKLMYIESLGHKIIYKTVDKEYKVLDKLSHAIQGLSQVFVCCHKSFVVNMSTISQLEKNKIVLKNGDIIPISTSRKKPFFEAYYRYIESKGDM